MNMELVELVLSLRAVVVQFIGMFKPGMVLAAL